jgi:hypothetical protein
MITEIGSSTAGPLLVEEISSPASSSSTMGENFEYEYEDQRKKLLAVFNRIAAFRHLPQGWDSYRAPQIDFATQSVAKRIAKMLWLSLGTGFLEPFVAPCSDGGILLEWELPKREISVTIGQGGTDLEYLVSEKATDTIVEEGATRNVGALVTRILIQLI